MLQPKFCWLIFDLLFNRSPLASTTPSRSSHLLSRTALGSVTSR
jgi:hypothetical protein